MKTSQPDLPTLRVALKRMEKNMAAVSKVPFTGIMHPGTIAALTGVNYITSQTVPTGNVFNAVERQVNRYKKNVISKEVLKSKHDTLYKAVDAETDKYVETEEHKAYISKVVAGRVRRHVMKLLYSKEFSAKLDKLTREILNNGIK